MIEVKEEKMDGRQKYHNQAERMHRLKIVISITRQTLATIRFDHM